MAYKKHLLKSNSFRAQDIHIHEDLMSTMPSALSRKREQKPGSENQEAKKDPGGYTECILCHENKKKERNPSGTPHEVSIKGRVSTFLNDFPYLPYEHRLYFLWNEDKEIQEQACHKYKIDDFSSCELYWLLRACKEGAEKFKSPSDSADRLRLIAGFNIGRIAGQSIAHFHLQSGWEVVLDPREFSRAELDLYYKELHAEDLIIFENQKYCLVAPWTPQGKYAVNFYFKGKNEITQLDDDDLKTFATIGNAIIRIYHKYLRITNVNIVLRGSVKDCRTEPLLMQFVPRVNLAAMYEILGVNVVDTFPQSIAAEFRRSHSDKKRVVLEPWNNLLESAKEYKPEDDFMSRISKPKAKKKPRVKAKKKSK